MKLEDYIKNLDPALQEKARMCGNAEELLALAKEAKVPVPDEALEAIAGGEDTEVGSCKAPRCPRCGSFSTAIIEDTSIEKTYYCYNCEYVWEVHPKG